MIMLALACRQRGANFRNGLNFHRAKSKTESKWELQLPLPFASELKPQWPSWLGDLLSVVHFNFQKGLDCFCVSCRKGLYQEKHFEKGGSHYGHRWLRMYDFQCSICVNCADIKDLGVHTGGIQLLRRCGPERKSALFLHNTFGYADHIELSMASSSSKNCVQCHTRLQFNSVDGTATKFCCLDCKFQYLNHAVTQQPSEESWPTLIAHPATHNLATAKMSPQSNCVMVQKFQTRIPTNAQHSGCNRKSLACSAHQSSHMALSESDVSVGDEENNDSPEQQETSAPEPSELDQSYLEISSGLDRDLWLDSLSLGFLTDSEDEITSPCDVPDELFDIVLQRGPSSVQARKCTPVEPLQIVIPGTVRANFKAVDTTKISTANPQAQLTAQSRWSSAKIEHITEGKQHSEGITTGHNLSVGYDNPEVHGSRCAGSDMAKSIDLHSSADVALVRLDPIIILPEALFEDDVFLAPREEGLSKHIDTPLGSPSSSPEDIVLAEVASDADSKPFLNPGAQRSMIPEFSPTPRLFQTALAAASCSSNLDNKWRRYKTGATMSNRDVGSDGGQGNTEEVEGLGLMPNSPSGSILRKAAYFLRTFDSEFDSRGAHMNNPITDSQTHSIQGSSSSSAASHGGPDVSIASPEVVSPVESFKIEASSIDVTSLKQLVATFDPRSWTSKARRSEVNVSPERPCASASILQRELTHDLYPNVAHGLLKDTS